jgi:diacylglycerol kinase family enzyme
MITAPIGYRAQVTPLNAPLDLAVVVNPERSDAAEQLLAALDGRDARPDADLRRIEIVRPPDTDHLATAIASAADRAGVVAVVGGDGSQRTAASVLADSSTVLAPVPGGTVNLLARVLGIDSVEAAADAIGDGVRRTIDLGVVEGETFVLNASSGYDADVIDNVDDASKRWGRLGYFVAGVQQLREARPRRVTVTVDGAVWYSGRAMSVIVTNVPQRGSASFVLARDGAPDDGLLDVVVQRCDSPTSIALAIWALVRDREPAPDDVLVAHGRVIDVHWSGVVMGQRDGDSTGMSTNFHHEVMPGALTVCVPG